MADKKTEVITFRTEEWVKNLLQIAADQNKWSIAQTVNEICKKFVCNPQPDRIIVKTKDIARVVGECLRENKESATEIIIDLQENEDKKELYKELRIRVLESGGLGCIDDFDNIKELSEEELLDIP